jgi:hypothetical protein
VGDVEAIARIDAILTDILAVAAAQAGHAREAGGTVEAIGGAELIGTNGRDAGEGLLIDDRLVENVADAVARLQGQV